MCFFWQKHFAIHTAQSVSELHRAKRRGLYCVGLARLIVTLMHGREMLWTVPVIQMLGIVQIVQPRMETPECSEKRYPQCDEERRGPRRLRAPWRSENVRHHRTGTVFLVALERQEECGSRLLGAMQSVRSPAHFFPQAPDGLRRFRKRERES